MSRLAILGPNLPMIPAVRRHGETFHVHAEGCADIARYGAAATQRGGIWVSDFETAEEVGDDIYSDQIGEGSMTVEDAVSDCWFAPCVVFP